VGVQGASGSTIRGPAVGFIVAGFFVLSVPACHSGTGVQSCADGGVCPSGQYCVQALAGPTKFGTPGAFCAAGCMSGMDCSSGSICCGTGVTILGACAAALTCPVGQKQICGTAVGTAGECPSGQFCFPGGSSAQSGGVCGPVCLSGMDCPQGGTCCAADGFPAECVTASVCPVGQTQMCGNAIGTGAGCPAGQSCHPGPSSTNPDGAISGGVCGPIDGGTGAVGGSTGAGGHGGGGIGGSIGSGGSGGGSGGTTGSGGLGGSSGATGSGGAGTTDGGNGSTNMPCTNGLGIQVDALVTEFDVVSGTPPTPMGGTISSGSYALTTYTVYGGSTGAETFKATSYISSDRISGSEGGVEQFLSVTTTESDDGSDGLIMSQGIFYSQGADGFGQVSPGCVGTGNIWNPQGFLYTATSTGLTIYESGPNGSTLAFGFKYLGD
jgi:collagen type VII alpha